MTLMLKRNQPVDDCPKLRIQATAKAATHVAPHYYRNVQTVIQTVSTGVQTVVQTVEKPYPKSRDRRGRLEVVFRRTHSWRFSRSVDFAYVFSTVCTTVCTLVSTVCTAVCTPDQKTPETGSWVVVCPACPACLAGSCSAFTTNTSRVTERLAIHRIAHDYT